MPVEEVLREFEAPSGTGPRGPGRPTSEAAVGSSVRTNQEMHAAERRLGTQELDGKKSLIDQQLAR